MECACPTLSTASVRNGNAYSILDEGLRGVCVLTAVVFFWEQNVFLPAAVMQSEEAPSFMLVLYSCYKCENQLINQSINQPRLVASPIAVRTGSNRNRDDRAYKKAHGQSTSIRVECAINWALRPASARQLIYDMYVTGVT